MDLSTGDQINPDELRKAVAELYLSGITGSFCGVLV